MAQSWTSMLAPLLFNLKNRDNSDRVGNQSARDGPFFHFNYELIGLLSWCN